MYVQRIEYTFADAALADEIAEAAFDYMSALRMNGQACGKEWPLYRECNALFSMILTPEETSLAQLFNNQYVNQNLRKLEGLGCAVAVVQTAKDVQGGAACACAVPSAYVLFTTYTSLESPVRCLDCFGSVPLYRLPLMPSGEFYELICWKSDYQSCDSLQMNCANLEAACTRQLSSLKSTLTMQGLVQCKTLFKSTNKPFYYYLYRNNGRSLSSEKKRCCPSCGGQWLLNESLHSLFYFKCDNCHLLSNIAFNVSHM